MRFIGYLLLLIVAVMVVVFASLNAEPVAFDYYVGIKHLPLSVLLILVFAAGSLFGLFLGMLMWLRAKHENRQLKKRIKLIDQQLEQIRTLGKPQ
ncbi:MAG: LapA family protein [Gammaproteobacteria bacterium]|nr:LapA family protein [Gammaproteobacteria bacterium]